MQKVLPLAKLPPLQVGLTISLLLNLKTRLPAQMKLTTRRCQNLHNQKMPRMKKKKARKKIDMCFSKMTTTSKQ